MKKDNEYDGGFDDHEHDDNYENVDDDEDDKGKIFGRWQNLTSPPLLSLHRSKAPQLWISLSAAQNHQI